MKSRINRQMRKSYSHICINTSDCRFKAALRPNVILMLSALISIFASLFIPDIGRTEPKSFPKVIMIEVPNMTPNDPDLFQAIRAQLSASPLQLERLFIENPEFIFVDSLENSSKLADEHQATVVFWILDNGISCTLFFYRKTATDRKIYMRALDFIAGIGPSRFETIGNAAAGIIEASVIASKKRPTPTTEQITNEPSQQPSSEYRYKVDIFAFYRGSLFSSRLVTHGIQMGLGLFPIDHLAVSLSYTHNLPAVLETDKYSLSIKPRNIEASIAARWTNNTIDFRLGVAWAMDLRSYSTQTDNNTISPRPDDLDVIQTIEPFILVTWIFAKRVGISFGVGANFALNERSYEILVNDDLQYEAMQPFIAKLNYRAGLVVRF